MKYFWMSWYQPFDETEDYKPLTYPPNTAILGWWCSGRTETGATICAWVKANCEEKAKEAIRQDWPEAEDWRFCDEKEKPTNSSRFPVSDWMIERFKGAE